MSLKKEDLELGSLLGKGAFAKVVLARDKRNGDEYALKIVDKKQIAQEGRQKSVLMERNLLTSFNCPGIVRLHLAWHDAVALYFLLEHAGGGELATQLARMHTFPLQFAQFYAAEIVVVLEYLRTKRVAHRDMKPENMLLTLHGHLKLIDFDAAVVVPSDDGEAESDGETELDDAVTVSFGASAQGQPNWAGTALYLPPEVVRTTARIRNAFALDLWALGCIVYQMLVGKTPFEAPTEPLAFQQILSGDYAFPEDFPHVAARDLVVALLAPRPRMRPGQGVEGLGELRRHPFFGCGTLYGEDFEGVLQRRPPPRAGQFQNRSYGSVSFQAGMSFESDCTPQEGHQFLTGVDAELVEVVGNPPDIAPVDVAIPLAKELVPDCAISGVAAGRAEVPSKLQLLSSPPVVPTQVSSLKGPRICIPQVEGEHLLSNMQQRGILRPGESIRIGGAVVRRRLPILKPRWMIVTDLPRILIMDPSCDELQHDFDFAGAVAVTVNGAFSFDVNVAGHRYKCNDTNKGNGGSREWATAINQARSSFLSSSHGAQIAGR